MTRKEAERLARQSEVLRSLGFTSEEAEQLRRISMTLHRWHERECGDGNGCIERDETTGKAYWLNSHTMKRSAVADREKGALKRLAAILGQRNGRPAVVNGRLNAAPAGKLTAYIQTDPRGAALYIIRPSDVPAGADVSAHYNRGICVY
jgi:hypothetical protein